MKSHMPVPIAVAVAIAVATVVAVPAFAREHQTLSQEQKAEQQATSAHNFAPTVVPKMPNHRT